MSCTLFVSHAPFVIPAQAGIQLYFLINNSQLFMPRFHGDDILPINLERIY